ncbi:MAG: hypothetical protein E6R14_08355 [Thermomicrobiales bacterium]|nr:MAG: hypothetical protein E6R14_08355 [Thermomicrobiales bacterium]
MDEMQREVSNRTLRSAVATRQAKPSMFSGLRVFFGTRLSSLGKQLAEPKASSVAGESTALNSAG